ncbi:MAG: Hsp20 family protein [Acidobacteria bacterium]|nr:Hsp20 family protein [Acidobacteriota bacterium]
MAGQTVLQPESSKPIAQLKPASDLFVEADQLLQRMQEVYQAIEQRAYQLFLERGGAIGQDAEDWFRAEAEYLLNLPINLEEEPQRLMVRAELPGFDSTALRLSIEPRRLLINGKMESRLSEAKEETALDETTVKELLCSIDLPCDIEAAQAQATFTNGILEIAIPKIIQTPEPITDHKIE